MVRCPACEHENAAGSEFCASCGASLAAVDSPTLASVGDAAASSVSVSVSRTGLHGRFEPGEVLGERYRIVGLLGKGGMGEVYRADDLTLGQSVALKFLPEAVASNPAAIERFRREVRTAREVTHPNVCRIHDIGEHEGQVFLSMEHVDGEDLASVLRRMGRPSREKSVEIARQLCMGLAAAHAAGVLHRDLKPANVMLDGRGRVRITDFGLAGLAEELEGAEGVEGTPAYMAPEQLAGKGVSVQSDLYSLGLVLYELFTGRRALEGRTPAELRREHEAGSITSASSIVPDLDPAVERVIERCLEREPAQRPPSAQAVLRALPGGDPLAEVLAAGETPSPELIAHAGEAGGLAPRVALGLLLATIAAVLGAWFGSRSNLPTEVPALPKDAPSVLAVRARDAVVALGWTMLPEAHADHGLRVPEELFDRPDREGREEPRPQRLIDVRYWQRWGVKPNRSTTFHEPTVKWDDPTFGKPGQARIELDGDGRLERLDVQTWPGERDPASPPAEPVDWERVFDLAGLDLQRFTPVPVDAPWSRDAPAEERRAWEGPWPEDASRRVRAVAGVRSGRVASWRLDWTPDSREEPLGDWMERYQLPSAGQLVQLSALLGAFVLAVRHWRTGRGDRRGALRVALFVTACYWLGGWAVFIPAGGSWLQVATEALYSEQLGHALAHGAALGCFYLAFEPFARRFWPLMLVGWSRLLSGRVRDPLVGREVLLGGAAAGAGMLSMLLTLGLVNASGGPPVGGAPWALDQIGSAPTLGWTLLVAPPRAVLFALSLVILLLLMRILLRRGDFAVAATVVLILAMLGLSTVTHEGRWIFALVPVVYVSLAGVLLLRVGLLAFTTFIWLGQTSGLVLPAAPAGSWLVGSQAVVLGTWFAVLAWAAWVSMAGRPLLAGLLDEEPAR